MLSVLRRRDVALLTFGSLISGLGDWLLIIAFPFYVYQVTGSPLATGGTFLAPALARLTIGPWAGVFVDRWDRRRTMIACDLARAGLLLPLLTIRSADSVWIVYPITVFLTACSQFFGPARRSLIPHLVERRDLASANSLDAIGSQLAMLLGAPIGGALLGLFGLGSVAILDSTSFLISAASIALIAGSTGRCRPPGRPSLPTPSPSRGRGVSAENASAAALPPRTEAVPRSGQPGKRGTSPRATIGLVARLVRGGSTCVGGWLAGAASSRRGSLGHALAEWRDGLRVVRADRALAVTFAVEGTSMLGQGIINVLWVVYLRDELRGGALDYGVVQTAVGLGAVAGGLLVGPVGRLVPPRLLIGLGATTVGALLLATFNVPVLVDVIAFNLLLGAPAIVWAVTADTLLQTRVADAFRGRVFAAYGTTQSVPSAVGMGLASALGSTLGVVPLLNLAGSLFMLAGILGLTLPSEDRSPRGITPVDGDRLAVDQ